MRSKNAKTKTAIVVDVEFGNVALNWFVWPRKLGRIAELRINTVTRAIPHDDVANIERATIDPDAIAASGVGPVASSVILRTPQYLGPPLVLPPVNVAKLAPRIKPAVVPAFSLSTVAVLLSPTHAHSTVS